MSVFAPPFIYVFYLIPNKWYRLLYLLPMFNFSKSFADVTSKSDIGFSGGAGAAGTGYNWSDITGGEYQDINVPPFVNIHTPSTLEMWALQGMCIVLYSLLTWYLDKVLPGEMGYKLPFYFMFTPSYWRNIFGKNKKIQLVDAFPNPEYEMDGDVASEVSAAKTVTENEVRIMGLTKEFASEHKLKRRDKTVNTFRAVDCIYLGVPKSTVQCILGHNGAGTLP